MSAVRTTALLCVSVQFNGINLFPSIHLIKLHKRPKGTIKKKICFNNAKQCKFSAQACFPSYKQISKLPTNNDNALKTINFSNQHQAKLLDFFHFIVVCLFAA